MSALAEIERFLERLFERTSARVFHARLRPVQLQRRIERAMELERVPGSARTVAPDRFRLRLAPADLTGLGDPDELGSLAERLADSALAFARAQGFQVLERPTVSLVADPAVEQGAIEVETGFGGRRPGAVPAAQAASPADAGSSEPGGDRPGSVRGTVDRGAPADADAAMEGRDVTRTMVYRRPVVAGPKAVLRIVDPRGRERTLAVDGSALSIGRARDNGLVVEDGRISRYHGRLQARRGALVYTDLGSTNGSRVNGLTVDEIALGLGDRIELGDTTIVVESLPG